MTRSLAVGDVDGDGDLDLVVGVTGLAPDEVLLNLGRDVSGAWLGFADATPLPEEPLATGAVALGDLDGDGDLDLVTGHLGLLVPDRLWLGDGTGGFALVATTLLGELNTIDIVFGDVDLDGDLDMVTANNKENRLWRNDGTAGFSIADSFDFPFADSTDIELTDLDGDGDLDLVVGNGSDVGIQIWLNGGLAPGGGNAWLGFSTKPLTLQRISVESLALGDLDGDGDPDLISGNGGDVPNQLWVNR